MLANDVDRGWLAIDSIALESVLQQVHEIAAVSASGIEHARSCIETAAQNLIEEVDVDVAELPPQFFACGELSHVAVVSGFSGPVVQLLVVGDAAAGAGAGAGAPGRRGICSSVNRGSRSIRIARSYTAAAITIADFFTSSSTTRS